MKRIVVLFSIFFCFNAFAVNVSITGKITKGGTDPVAGAQISLKNHPSIKAVSGSDGTYNLNGNTRALAGPWMIGTSGIAVRSMKNGTGIIVRTDVRRSNVKVDIYKINGGLVASKHFSGVNSGEHAVSFGSAACGALIVKVSDGNGSRTFKAIPGMGISYAMVSGNRDQGSLNAGLGKRSASVSDSVVVYSQGYRTGLTALVTYEKTGVDVSLTASNSWTPIADSLKHSKGMVRIMAKTYDFDMGQPVDTIWGTDATGLATSSDEQPVHNVTFAHNFWMDTTEVTQSDYDSLMKKHYSSYHAPKWDATHGLGANYPANLVNWSSAILYCNARSAIEGLTDTAYAYTAIKGTMGTEACSLVNVSVNTASKAYRLPTEAEWEYACKGGTANDYYWGKDFSYYLTATVFTEVSENAVWAKNSKEKGAGNTGYGMHEVAKTKPNKYGLYDMIGNASEWCHDDYLSYTWGQTTDSVTPVKEIFHPIRGGNWGNEISYLRSQCRTFEGSSDYFPFFLGFRVARTDEN